MEQKTVLEWFESVEETVLKSVLLERYDEGFAHYFNGKDTVPKKADDIFEAIFNGFEWGKSPEGGDFWHDIAFNKSFDSFYEKYPKEKVEPEISPVQKLIDAAKDYKTAINITNNRQLAVLCASNLAYSGKIEVGDLLYKASEILKYLEYEEESASERNIPQD